MAPKVLLFCLALLALGCKHAIRYINNDKIYSIVDTRGNDEDVKKIYFAAPKKFDLKGKLIHINFYKNPRSICITSDSVFLGCYNIEASDTTMFINNYSVLREEVSFRDPNERRYKVIAQIINLDKLTITLSNAGDNGILLRPVVFTCRFAGVP